MRSGCTPSDIRSLDDLRKLPLLGKDDVRENLHFDLLSDNHEKRKILKVTTSGSTGEPFVCYADQHQLEIRWAATQRSMEWTGYRFGDRCARLWHQTIGMSWPQILRERIDAWFNRRLFIPAFEMSDQNIASFVEQAARLPAGAPRRLCGIVQLPRPLHPESRARELPSQGGDLVGAGAAGAEPRDHREDPRLRRLRQVRQPRVLRHRLRVRAARRPSRRRRELRRRDPEGRRAGEAGRVGRGRDHRPQQLLRAADPLSRRRPRRRHGRRRSPAAAGAGCPGSGGSRAGSRRSSSPRTAPTFPARSSPTCSRITTT